MRYDTNSLESHWMPFTAYRDFKADPRLVVKSEGMYCWDHKGGKLIDGSSGLFCCPAGHNRREIAEFPSSTATANGLEKIRQDRFSFRRVRHFRMKLQAEDGKIPMLYGGDRARVGARQ